MTRQLQRLLWLTRGTDVMTDRQQQLPAGLHPESVDRKRLGPLSETANKHGSPHSTAAAKLERLPGPSCHQEEPVSKSPSSLSTESISWANTSGSTYQRNTWIGLCAVIAAVAASGNKKYCQAKTDEMGFIHRTNSIVVRMLTTITLAILLHDWGSVYHYIPLKFSFRTRTTFELGTHFSNLKGPVPTGWLSNSLPYISAHSRGMGAVATMVRAYKSW